MKRKEVDDVLEEGEGKGMDIADGECNPYIACARRTGMGGDSNT